MCGVYLGRGPEFLSDCQEQLLLQLLVGSLLGANLFGLTIQTNRIVVQGVLVPRLLGMALSEAKPVGKRTSPRSSPTASALPLLVSLASPHMVP